MSLEERYIVAVNKVGEVLTENILLVELFDPDTAITQKE